MPVFRLGHSNDGARYFVNAFSALEAIELITRIVGADPNWRAEPAAAEFYPEPGFVYDQEGNPIEGEFKGSVL